MKIFDIVEGKVVINPSALVIPELKEIWKRDKAKTKTTAYREISYIVFLCDTSVSNPYRGVADSTRADMLKKDIMQNEKWVEDDLIKTAIAKYKDLQQTTNTRLLKSAKGAAEKLAKYFESVDFSERDSQGRPVYSAKDVASNLSSVGNIVKSLNQLEEQVKKEASDASSVRGGGDMGMYEIPREDLILEEE